MVGEIAESRAIISPPPVRFMTPTEVLRYFSVIHQWSVSVGEADGSSMISTEMTVSQWCDAMLIDQPWEIGGYLECTFEITCSRREWDSVLKPRKSKTLGAVCEFIASRARVLNAEPAQVLGVRCEKAGIFLAIRRRLEQVGADVSTLRPSSSLRDFAFHGLPTIVGELVRISPIVKTKVEMQRSSDGLHLLGAVVLLLASIGLGVPAFVRPWPWLLIFALVFGSFVLIWWHSGIVSKRPPKCVSFRELRTFRDLCELMVGDWRPSGVLRCPRCRYPLHALLGRRCPECGTAFSGDTFGVNERTLEDMILTPLPDEPRGQ